MSPERFDGQGDERVDVYALGATLYELVALRPAFPGNDQIELLDRIRKEEPPPLDRLVPGLPRDLQTIIEKCLAKEPSRRYRGARDLADDLQRYLESRPIRARRASLPERLIFWSRRNPAAALLLGVLLVAVVAALVAALEFRTQSEENRRLAQSESKARGEAQEALENVAVARNELRGNLYFANMNLAINALENLNGSRQARRLLDPWPPVPGESDLRGFEWYLLSAVATDGEAIPLAGYGWLLQFAWTRSFLVARTGLTELEVWDAAARERRYVLRGRGAGLIAVSPDERWVAFTDTDRSIRVVDLSSGELRFRIPTASSWPLTLVFDASGEQLHLVGRREGGGAVYELWDLAAQSPIRTEEFEETDRAAVSPDGHRIAVANGSGRIEVLNGQTMDVSASFETDGAKADLSFGREGRMLAAIDRDGGVLRVWEITSRRLMHEVIAHRNITSRVGFSPEGRHVVVCGADQSLFVLDLDSGASWRVTGPTRYVHSFAFEPPGTGSRRRLVAGGTSDPALFAWDLDGPVALRSIPTGRQLRGLQFFAEGRRLLVSSLGYSAGLIEVDSGGLSEPPTERPIGCSEDGQTWLDIARGELEIVDRETGDRRVVPIPGGPPDVRRNTTLLVEADVVLVSDGATVWWTRLDALEPAKVLVKDAYGAGTLPMAVSPLGDRVVVGAGGTFYQYDLLSGATLSTLHGYWVGHSQIAYHPDGRSLAIACDDHRILIWDLQSDSEPRVFLGHTQKVLGLSFSPDGSRLASTSEDGSVKLWETTTGRVALSLRHDKPVLQVAWSRDGERLATGTRDGTVRVYAAASAYREER